MEAPHDETAIREILDFWFRGHGRADWFGKDPRFDALVRQRLGALHEAAAAGTLDSWRSSPRGALALVLLLDQVPRHLYRGMARAFATDSLALSIAKQVIQQGWDRTLQPVERLFLYLPFEHSESMANQEQALKLMSTLTAWPETADAYHWAVRHWEVIRRFGRFPHRNAALGRQNTPEEEQFLREPGSSL